ncbi:MAG: hypothetical protein HGA53_08650, partial [Anaerolineaceae bacterium]|nr:hypothetical protein [Anaerolineaceae bacterium]
CASLSIHNILTRAHLHRQWWLNDPDCMLVRPDTELTLAEVQTLATAISITGGSLLLSDDLPKIPADRLRMAVQMVPVIDKRPQVLDWLDEVTPARLKLDLQNPCGDWTLVAMFNWSDLPSDITLNLSEFQIKPGNYFLSSFWDCKTSQVSPETPVVFSNVPAHGVVLAAVRPVSPEQPVYVGSDLHISQGMEVASWKVSEEHLECGLALPREAEGHVSIMLPKPPRQACINGTSVAWRVLAENIYSFPVSFCDEGQLVIEY